MQKNIIINLNIRHKLGHGAIIAECVWLGSAEIE